MTNLKSFALMWVLMWATTYIAVAFIAPTVGGTFNNIYMCLYGVLLTLCVVGQFLVNGKHVNVFRNFEIFLSRASKIGLFVFAIAEVIAGVMSWTGALRWNLPFPNTEIFQVSMAFMDLVAATLMFVVVFDKD